MEAIYTTLLWLCPVAALLLILYLIERRYNKEDEIVIDYLEDFDPTDFKVKRITNVTTGEVYGTLVYDLKNKNKMSIIRYITSDVSDTDGEDSITLFTEGQKVELVYTRLSNETLSGVEVFVDGGDFIDWICPSLLTSKIPVNEEE